MLAFPGILALHAIGMALAAGLAGVLDLRILGVAQGVPLIEFRRFQPVLWGGFWLNAVSGVLLLVGYPTKALTNPVFYLKLLLIAVAMVLFVRIDRLIRSGDPAEPTTARSLRRHWSLLRGSRVTGRCWCTGSRPRGERSRLRTRGCRSRGLC